MSKDFAKRNARHRSTVSGKSAVRRRRSGASKDGSGLPPQWLWLGGGVLLGILLSLLFQLATMPLGNKVATTSPATAPPAADQPGGQARAPEEFTFFEILRENEVIVEDPPAEEPAAEAGENAIYYLQAGSFPSEEAAESRRAEIAFMGQETAIERVEVNGQVRYRVMIGPIDSRERQRAIRNKLSGQGIETLAYKRDRA